jgi:hypothetical protein
MKHLESIWDWLVYSSANPSKYSLFLKGTLVTIATYASVVAGFAHISVPSDLITQIIDGIVAIVQDFLMLVAVVAATVGAIRKVVLTITGNNVTPAETTYTPDGL